MIEGKRIPYEDLIKLYADKCKYCDTLEERLQKANKRNDELVERINYIYFNKISETKMKHSKYSKYEVEPKQIYPAFRRFSRYKLSDIIKMIRIKNDNIRLENKLSEIKSSYERG